MTEPIVRSDLHRVAVAFLRALFAFIALAGTLAALAGMGTCFVFLIMDAPPPVDADPTGFWTAAVFVLFGAGIVWNYMCDLVDRLLARTGAHDKGL